jgi:hypothetical protein
MGREETHSDIGQPCYLPAAYREPKAQKLSAGLGFKARYCPEPVL